MATLVTAYPSRTKYPKGVKPPSINMLKPGANNAKLGGYITAKKWQGMAMYSLTLQERATCPTSCEQWDNCFLPETKVLTADMRWVRIDSLAAGDHIAGFDEERPLGSHLTQRKTQWATVEALTTAVRPSVKLTTDRGEISTAKGHLFLAKKNRKGFKWYEANELQPGDEIKYVIAPWEEDLTYGAGRIRGFVEGEGTCGAYDNLGFPKARVAWAQRPGKLNDEINKLVRERKFNIHEREVISGVIDSTIISTDITGGWRETLRFLGTFRPTRLVEKSRAMYENHGIDGRGSPVATVTKIEDLDLQTTVMIKTSTKTLVAEGFAAHNCYGNNMPFAHRFDHTAPDFYTLLEEQLAKLNKKHAGEGFVIRLHVLGDFFSDRYVRWWGDMLLKYPELNAFGYTHRTCSIGFEIAKLNQAQADRWQIRFSDDKNTLMSAHVVDKNYLPVKGQEVICPEQQGKTKSCATCGLCWSAPNLKIMFVEH